MSESSKRRRITKAVRHVFSRSKAALRGIVRRTRETPKHTDPHALQPLSLAQTLPTEILLSIFGQLSHDKKSLAACTLACRSWSGAASESLLRYVSLICYRCEVKSKKLPPDPSSSLTRAIIHAAPSRLSTNMLTLVIDVPVIDYTLLSRALVCLTRLKWLFMGCDAFKPLSPTYRPPTDTLELPEVHLNLTHGAVQEKQAVVPDDQCLADILVLFHHIRQLAIGRYNQPSAGGSRLLQQFQDRRVTVEQLNIIPSQPLGCIDPKGIKQLDLNCERHTDLGFLNGAIVKYAANAGTLKVRVHQGLSVFEGQTLKRLLPMSLTDCTPALRSLVLDFDKVYPIPIMLLSWRVCLDGLSHPHVEKLDILIRTRYWPFAVPGLPDLTTHALLKKFVTLLPWQSLDNAVMRCPELKRVRLSLDIGVYSLTRKSLHAPILFNQVPEPILRQLSRRTRNMLDFDGRLQDDSYVLETKTDEQAMLAEH